jgi:hypothetical protein
MKAQDRICTKNLKTDKMEVIKQYEVSEEDWGFSFFVDDELAAYKAAYLYRHNKHGVKIRYAGGAQRWMVTVFNQTGAELGLNE